MRPSPRRSCARCWRRPGSSSPAAALAPCAYERLRPLTPGRWPDGGGCLQVYRTRLDADAPDLDGSADDVIGWRWVTMDEFEALCGAAFWWPLVVAVFPS